MGRQLSGLFNFMWAGVVTKRIQTGSVVPSQRYLVEKMIAPIPTSYKGEILELGAGTGALTVRLAKRCPKARILACEINPKLARDLRRNLDRAGINGQVQVLAEPAEQLLARIAAAKGKRIGYVLSGIPLGNVSKEKTVALIAGIDRTLGKNGMYIQFQYSLLDRKKIRSFFPRLRTSHVLLNFPPAFIYYARK
jgi:phosphatidylethanolamine/phosphatidyl-N-methylethanolamine N-methyltransferase